MSQEQNVPVQEIQTMNGLQENNRVAANRSTQDQDLSDFNDLYDVLDNKWMEGGQARIMKAR